MATQFYIDAQGNPVNLTGGGAEKGSVSVVADTLARRDSAGRLKAAAPVKDEDLCTRGYTRNAYTPINQEVEFSITGWSGSTRAITSGFIRVPFDGWVYVHGFEYQPYMDILVYENNTTTKVTFITRSMQYYTTLPSTGGYYFYDVAPVRAGQYVRVMVHSNNFGGVVKGWFLRANGVKT